MIRGGVARLERSKRRHNSSPVFTALREEEDKAKNRHVGIWYLGDVADSDEDESPSVKGAPKGKPTKEAGIILFHLSHFHSIRNYFVFIRFTAAKDAPAAAPKKK